jgi:epoxyqueuosine reductase
MDQVLLHICCAPCSIVPAEHFISIGMDVIGYWYNPNIHPYSEHLRRLDTLYKYVGIEDLPLVVDKDYDLANYLSTVLSNLEDRCRLCYRIRLRRTAEYASVNGYRAFSTSLLYSRYMKHDQVKEEGMAAARDNGVEFIYHDFRPEWQKGIAKSKELGLYRQNYCGCIFSERERF